MFLNKEERKIYNIKYREANREMLRIKSHEYYEANKARLKIRYAKYYRANKEYYVLLGRKHTKINKFKCISHYSNTDVPSCNCCGENNIDILTIDHLNGNGTNHRKQIRGGLYKWLIDNNYPDGYDVLCCNCNVGKGIDKDCPHKWSDEYISKKLSNGHYTYQRMPILQKFSDGEIKCRYCNENNIFFLAVDHISGNGAKHVRNDFNNNRSRYRYWLKTTASIEDFQILCHNCNFLKYKNNSIYIPEQIYNIMQLSNITGRHTELISFYTKSS